jgi:kynurenine formamidase
MRAFLRSSFAAVLVSTAGTNSTAQVEPNHALVTKAQLAQWSMEFSNSGRWGKDDQLGALNLITPAKRKQAASLVRDGISMSLGNDLAGGPRPTIKNAEGEVIVNSDGAPTYLHIMIGPGFDAVNMDTHIGTHMDSLAHRQMCWSPQAAEEESGKTCRPAAYNGYVPDMALVMKNGHPQMSINAIKDGVLTRGLLMDIARLKGLPYLKRGTKIYVDDLEAWEKRAGVKVSSGDALVVRTGITMAPSGAGGGQLDDSVLPWLRQRDVAVMVFDSSVSQAHFTGIVLATCNIHSVNLEALSDALAARNRWEFMFSVAPLRIPGGTGSPVNPIATF